MNYYSIFLSVTVKELSPNFELFPEIVQKSFPLTFTLQVRYGIIRMLPPPDRHRKGGLTYGLSLIISHFRLGECSCLLPLQMVGQKEVSGNQPKV